MQSRTDAALRKIIEGEAPVKVKRECLAAMEAPSSSFLAELVNGDYPPKLKVDAARRLAEIQEAKQHRAEVDAILKQETERLAKRDPDKKTATPPVVAQSPRPENGQAPKITVAQPIPAQPIPVAVTPESTPATPAAAQPPGTVPVPCHIGEAASTARDPRPFFYLPKGAILERDEQSRLLELFRIVVDSTKTDSQRRAARLQLEKVIPAPDAGRSTFAIYLLAKLDWLERHPEQKPKLLQGETPASEPNPEYELFSMNFSTQRYFQQIAEQERIRKLMQNVETDRVLQGSMWDGIPSI